MVIALKMILLCLFWIWEAQVKSHTHTHTIEERARGRLLTYGQSESRKGEWIACFKTVVIS